MRLSAVALMAAAMMANSASSRPAKTLAHADYAFDSNTPSQSRQLQVLCCALLPREDALLTLRNNRQEVDPGYEPPIFVAPTPGGDSTEPQNITVYLGEELNLEFVVIQRTGQQADIIVSGFACVFMEM